MTRRIPWGLTILLILYSTVSCQDEEDKHILEDKHIPEDQLKIETTETGDCTAGVAKTDDFVTIHFKGYFEDGSPISTT